MPWPCWGFECVALMGHGVRCKSFKAVSLYKIRACQKNCLPSEYSAVLDLTCKLQPLSHFNLQLLIHMYICIYTHICFFFVKDFKVRLRVTLNSSVLLDQTFQSIDNTKSCGSSRVNKSVKEVLKYAVNINLCKVVQFEIVSNWFSFIYLLSWPILQNMYCR